MPRIYTLKNQVFIALLSGILAMHTAQAYDMHDNAILHAQQGQLLMEREQYSMAIEEYKAAILLNPSTTLSASLYNDLGNAYAKSGQYAFAIASIQHACRLQPNYAIFYQNLINTYRDAGQLEQAEWGLRQIVKDNYHDSEAWFMLGLLYKAKGNKTLSKSAFTKFIQLKPDSEMRHAAEDAL